eukprot:359938-Chlamydomonas_euryale.AAC.5
MQVSQGGKGVRWGGDDVSTCGRFQPRVWPRREPVCACLAPGLPECRARASRCACRVRTHRSQVDALSGCRAMRHQRVVLGQVQDLLAQRLARRLAGEAALREALGVEHERAVFVVHSLCAVADRFGHLVVRQTRSGLCGGYVMCACMFGGSWVEKGLGLGCLGLRVTSFVCCWVAGWLGGWLGGWVAGWVSGWVGEWLAGWLAGWGALWLGDRMKGRETARKGSACKRHARGSALSLQGGNVPPQRRQCTAPESRRVMHRAEAGREPAGVGRAGDSFPAALEHLTVPLQIPGNPPYGERSHTATSQRQPSG